MNFSNEIPSAGQEASMPSKLDIVYSWTKNKATLNNADNPSERLYIADFHTVKAPHVIFESATDGSRIGTGTVHAISIDAKYEIHGRKGTLQAMRRLKAEYTYPSYALSEDGKTPVAMKWIMSCGLKNWDFVCLDDQEMPIAKIKANTWACKKAGVIEFMNTEALSPELRDEVVVTGVTLWLCMLLRSTNFFSLFGAMFAKTGRVKGGETPAYEKDGGLKGEEVRV